MHSANRLLPLPTPHSPPPHPTRISSPLWRWAGVEERWGGDRWLRTAHLLAASLPSLKFISHFWSFSGLSCPGRGGRWCGCGVEGLGAEEWRWGGVSTCTGSWSGSGTCTCRHHTVGVGPGPGCSLDPGREAPLGSFSGRPPPPDTATPAGCWIRSGLLRKPHTHSLEYKVTITPSSQCVE